MAEWPPRSSVWALRPDLGAPREARPPKPRRMSQGVTTCGGEGGDHAAAGAGPSARCLRGAAVQAGARLVGSYRRRLHQQHGQGCRRRFFPSCSTFTTNLES
ncbi:unnamed protein product [Urochloa humidicola]